MSILLRRAMDALYLLCVMVAGSALVLISAVVPWGVFTRYVLNSAASWTEATAVLLTIVLTFIGAAACYRVGAHMSVAVLVRMLPRQPQWLVVLVSEAFVATLAVFMVIWGSRLVEATWENTIDAFPFLSVGVTYLPIPIGGVITLLFVIERVIIGQPSQAAEGAPH
jgi:TRAP-type C4-dicarboxylate transport system permease small subunit